MLPEEEWSALRGFPVSEAVEVVFRVWTQVEAPLREFPIEAGPEPVQAPSFPEVFGEEALAFPWQAEDSAFSDPPAGFAP